jgi:uncharacterized protein YjbI with pentapeptide repeats
VASDEDTPPDPKTYPGKGWGLASFARVREWPEVVTAPLAAAGMLTLAILFGVGVFLIYSLIQRVIAAGADTVPAAGAALTAIAAIFGAAFFFWRTLVAHWQARANQDQVTIARESHYTTLFTKAVELLGSTREVKETLEVDDGAGGKRREAITKTEPNLEVRLGAIYALERIAQDSDRDHWPIMEVLCRYVRAPHNCGEPAPLLHAPEFGTSDHEKWVHSIRPARSDVQAAVGVIGRRSPKSFELERRRQQSIDLSDANLQRAHIAKGCFASAILERVTLDGAILGGSRMEFAFLFRAHIHGAYFDGANLENSIFDEADVAGSSFAQTNLSAAHMREARIYRSSFDGANLDIASADGSRFDSVSFAESSLVWTSFNNASLSRVKFVAANLTNASFKGAFLGQTLFHSGTLDGASFEGATFLRVGFFGVDLSKVRGLTQQYLEECLGDRYTGLPDGLQHPDHWSATRTSAGTALHMVDPYIS